MQNLARAAVLAALPVLLTTAAVPAAGPAAAAARTSTPVATDCRSSLAPGTALFAGPSASGRSLLGLVAGPGRQRVAVDAWAADAQQSAAGERVYRLAPRSELRYVDRNGVAAVLQGPAFVQSADARPSRHCAADLPALGAPSGS